MKEIELLREKVKSLEDINHIMAHNLRGAASNIKMLTDVLIEREKEERQPTSDCIIYDGFLSTNEIVTCLAQSSDKLVNTLDTLMESVESSLNKKESTVDCNVEEIVSNITSQLNGVIFQKRAKIILHLALTKINYVKVYLESLLYNLINNAIKYSHPDIPLEIDISTRLANGRTVLEVKDNGIGIDMNKFGNKLFKLNQVFHTTKDSKGVGLYITKKHIESLGGNIFVESRVNAGTQFTIVL